MSEIRIEELDSLEPKLEWLGKLLKQCPHLRIIYNDDPQEGEPIGYTLRIESCSRMQVTAPTLGRAVELAMTTKADEDGNVIVSEGIQTKDG